MQSLEDFKRERLETFLRRFGTPSDAGNYIHVLVPENGWKAFLEETIDLLSRRTEEVVEEIIGQPGAGVRKDSSIEPWVRGREDLRKEQRLRAKTLLGGDK